MPRLTWEQINNFKHNLQKLETKIKEDQKYLRGIIVMFNEAIEEMNNNNDNKNN